MGKTIRTKPSSCCYFRNPKHINYKKLEESAKEQLKELGIVITKCYSFKNRIIDNWDDKFISYYRGQAWHKK